MNTLCNVLIISSIACCMTACSRSEASRQPEQAGKPAVAVETITAAPSDMIDSVEVTGNLEPKFSVDVKTQIAGLVKQVFVSEWVRVRKGQPLARIDVAETETMVKKAEAGVESARAAQAQALVALNRAERERDRSIKLKQAGLATQQSVDDAGTEQAAASARLVASKAQLSAAREELRQARTHLSKGLVTSPINGVVALREVNVGDLTSDAATSKPIFRIVDNRLLNLTVTVSSADSGRINVGQPLEFTVDSLPGKTFTGKVMYINPELSSVDRSLKVIAEVMNPQEQLKGGLFAKGRIVIGKKNAVLQVPRNAIDGFDLAANRGALFVIDRGVARRSAVVTGAANGERIEIVSGLKAGQRYVIRGGFNLKDGDKVVVTGGV